MTGTSASLLTPPGRLMLPPPKLRIRTLQGGVTAYEMFDGNQMLLGSVIQAVMTGLPDAAFEQENKVELRLFRYSGAKSPYSKPATPSRWAALPHVETTGIANPGSPWLGGLPAALAPDGQRLSGVRATVVGANNVVDVANLCRYWLRFADVYARTSASTISAKIICSTWQSRDSLTSDSWGLSRNIKPARFALGFVAYDSETQRWYQASGLSTFVVQNKAHPFVWDPSHPDSVAPTPGNAGRRIYAANPTFNSPFATARITRSEALPGW